MPLFFAGRPSVMAPGSAGRNAGHGKELSPMRRRTFDLLGQLGGALPTVVLAA
jgi:hypothetical protein